MFEFFKRKNTLVQHPAKYHLHSDSYSPRHISKEGFEVILKRERCYLHPTEINNEKVIGYNHVWHKDLGNHISYSQAICFLKEDLADLESYLNEIHSKMSDNRFAALIVLQREKGKIEKDKLKKISKSKNINNVKSFFLAFGDTSRRKQELELFFSNKIAHENLLS